MIRAVRFALPIALAGSAILTNAHAASDAHASGAPAADVVRAAIARRLERADAEVHVLAIDLPSSAPAEFKDAMPDPGSRLGRPMRFVLRPMTGRPVVAVVTASVVADQAVLGRAVNRGDTLAAADVLPRRGVVEGLPLRRLPALADFEGARARRQIDAGHTLTPVDVLARRAVEPGDSVTVVAVSGVVEVSATLVAADGGDMGDVIRVVNPDTRRDMRARVTGRGRVEVTHGR